MKSHEPSSRIRVDQIRTEKIFQQTNWPQMELKTIDAPIIVSTRTGLFDGQDQIWKNKLEGEFVDRIACLEEGNSKCAAKYGFISKTKWRREILDLVPKAQRFFL